MIVKQPTAMPTRKLSSAVLTMAVMEIARVFVIHYWPTWYDPTLWDALTPLVAGVVGYMVHDADNSP